MTRTKTTKMRVGAASGGVRIGCDVTDRGIFGHDSLPVRTTTTSTFILGCGHRYGRLEEKWVACWRVYLLSGVVDREHEAVTLLYCHFCLIHMYTAPWMKAICHPITS